MANTPEREAGFLKLIASTVINFHKKFISPVDGDRCRMKPTCSSYSHQAYKEYGFFWGTLLTFDRLLHEGNEYAVSPLVHNAQHPHNGKKSLLIYDPLENNVFWWNGKKPSGG